jgi:hypothetical protein
MEIFEDDAQFVDNSALTRINQSSNKEQREALIPKLKHKETMEIQRNRSEAVQ